MDNEFSIPSLEEFSKNPDKYRANQEQKFIEVDEGSQNLKNVQRHIYEIEGFRCKNLEEVQKVAKNQGIPFTELDYKPEIMPMGGGKCDILVRFVPKWRRQQRVGW